MLFTNFLEDKLFLKKLIMFDLNIMQSSKSCNGLVQTKIKSA
jgi:hypothetical protein